MIRKLAFLLTLSIVCITSRAELAGDPTDPDFIHATMLIAAPGKAIYQVSGHTFIRMECPAAGLDYCFTFENESAGKFGQLFQRVNGRFISLPTHQYMKEFTDAGRTIASLPLNLEPLQKQRLWQVLDSLTMTGMHPFNIRNESCSGHILKALDISLSPDSIKAIDSHIIGSKNGRGLKYATEAEGPWRTDIILICFGNDADIVDPLYNQALPIILASEWKDFRIYSPEGTSKPLFLSPDIHLHPRTDAHPGDVTPMMVAVVFLALSILCICLSMCRSGKVFVRIVEIIYAMIISVGGMLLMIICSVPSAIAGLDNLNFLFLNPLPLLLLPHGRSKRWQAVLRIILFVLWSIYILGPLFTHSIPFAMSIFALSSILVFIASIPRRVHQ